MDLRRTKILMYLSSVCLILNLFINLVNCHGPNILFIMVDDLGWNDIGYHGSEIRTPHLDALANNGVKLENYYTAPVCGPTRAQFLTGKYSIHLGTNGANFIACRPTGVPVQFPTIADKLKDLSYSTHLIGKWHAGFHTDAHLPTNRGFDTFRGFLLGHGDHYTHTRAWKGVKYLDYHDNTAPYNQSWGRYSTDMLTDRTVELIEEHNSTKPMFLFLSYQAPHNPLQVPSEYLRGYENIDSVARRNYAAMVTAIDSGVGRVVDSLRRAGELENTVIIFTSDNGGDDGSGGNNFPLKGGKGSYYEGGIRSVGFVSGPFVLRPRRHSQDLMHVTDWMPTLLRLAGDNLTNLETDGIDQWRTISMGFKSKRNEILHNIRLKPPTRQNRQRKQEAINQSAANKDLSFPRSPFGHSTNAANNIQNRFRQLTSSPNMVFNQSQARHPNDIYGHFDTDISAALTVGDWKILTGRQSKNYHRPNPARSIRLWEFMRLRRGGDFELHTPAVQVYNIIDDPEENKNVADVYPHITDTLLRTLRKYQDGIVESSMRGRVQKSCDPSLHGGVWGSYMGIQI